MPVLPARDRIVVDGEPPQGGEGAGNRMKALRLACIVLLAIAMSYPFAMRATQPAPPEQPVTDVAATEPDVSASKLELAQIKPEVSETKPEILAREEAPLSWRDARGRFLLHPCGATEPRGLAA